MATQAELRRIPLPRSFVSRARRKTGVPTKRDPDPLEKRLPLGGPKSSICTSTHLNPGNFCPAICGKFESPYTLDVPSITLATAASSSPQGTQVPSLLPRPLQGAPLPTGGCSISRSRSWQPRQLYPLRQPSVEGQCHRLWTDSCVLLCCPTCLSRP